MVYLEKKEIGKETYFYLVKNIRLNKQFKKFRIYLGKGKISKIKLQELKSKYSKVLGQRIKNYLVLHDPLLGLLSKKQIKSLDKIKREYKKHYKKLPREVREKHYEDFLVRFTYNTNAIEGSTVTLNETRLILLDKITPPNKTLRELKEVENHKSAFEFILKYKGDITNQFVFEIHRILTTGILSKSTSGKFRKVQVFIAGVEKIPPKPKFIEKEFKDLMGWYNKNKKKYHPVILTSYFHAAFEGIHPFIDFNGRSGRLLLNFILMKHNVPIIDIKYNDRLKYYESLRKAQEGNLGPFVNLIVKYLKDELNKVKV
ncbi:MAG: Fic family protein [Nanoarchaeota archaeon]|nr:Fic family protein [Nanoarchaeota archaeon]